VIKILAATGDPIELRVKRQLLEELKLYFEGKVTFAHHTNDDNLFRQGMAARIGNILDRCLGDITPENHDEEV
jgi:hemerythrin-like domain-containing protein